jgi:hypothetical protein
MGHWDAIARSFTASVVWRYAGQACKAKSFRRQRRAGERICVGRGFGCFGTQMDSEGRSTT